MYNEDIPTRAELPTSRQLIRSTLIAIASAITILVTIILPAEYAIDPTGIGGTLGLGVMGEIKQQLAKEAEEDRLKEQQNTSPTSPDPQSSLFDATMALLFISPAAAQTVTSDWREEISITLTPGQGAEVKLVMMEGATAQFMWKVEGGRANFDLHGDGGGKSISYQKGRGVPGDEGTLKAAFDGNHGWFWRNRTKNPITVTLRVKGSYEEMKRVL